MSTVSTVMFWATVGLGWCGVLNVYMCLCLLGSTVNKKWCDELVKRRVKKINCASFFEGRTVKIPEDYCRDICSFQHCTLVVKMWGL